MSRIQNTFAALKQQGKQALIPYITAGDPRPGITVELMHALVEGGSDILELGVPFSDPMADGPVIQRANERALAHKTSLKKVVQMVAEFRQTNAATPVVLMGYANPIEHWGYEGFASAAQAAGVDGVLIVDMPPEEATEVAGVLKAHAIDPIFLMAPTTPVSRLQAIDRLATGYGYYVSLKGVTGASNLDLVNVAEKLAVIKQHLSIPVGVGFGIRDADSARTVAQIADAVVIGSRLVQEVEAGEEGLAQRLTAFLKGIRAAMDTARA